jgi:hypothetical protein
MAWIAPRTWTSGELVSAAHLNEQIRDNMTVLKVAIADDGRIPAISAVYFANLSGASLTGVVKTAVANNFTAGKQDFNAGATTRLVLPVGADRWAT